ncbi:AraC family transcriptional regulator [Verrucomicrobia bacterium S94]|nr:AraC family transcriptional regulator [Verrucomicrobia bacterium S94]
MARSSLEHKFKKVFGRTPAEEIRRLRINKARKLLSETDMSMQEIAEACGYSSYNYLSLSFKQITGMPPGNTGKTRASYRTIPVQAGAPWRFHPFPPPAEKTSDNRCHHPISPRYPYPSK